MVGSQMQSPHVEMENKAMHEENVHVEDGIECPRVCMEFESEDDAYDFYNTYAGNVGFSIRKDWINRSSNGVVRRRQFVCSRQGKRTTDRKDESVQESCRETRIGCLAHLKIALQLNGKYQVIEFEKQHNHMTEMPQHAHMLRSKRKFTSAHAAMDDSASSSGIAPKDASEPMTIQTGGQHCLGYLEEDYKNYLFSKRQKAMEKFDAGVLLEHFPRRQVDEPGFIYSIQLDEDDQITNIFWADSKMLLDCERFGDVVCFDTTYKTNNYGRPFAPFIGVNHHKQTVVFGAALLYDETVESFKWLFRNFCDAVSGKKPNTILTDQDAAIATAIKEEMPGTVHRICVWHMYQNACKYLSHVFGASKTFAKDFSSCMFDYEYEDDFLQAWDKMLKKYSLHDNDWLKERFKEREKWALVYGRDTFLADMITTQRSESFNKHIKDYLNIRHSMRQFFDRFEALLDQRRREELKANFKMTQTCPKLCMPSKILTQASVLYTPIIFEMFQEEFKMSYDMSVKESGQEGSLVAYDIQEEDKRHSLLVVVDTSNASIQCCCQKFEFVGILCRHALTVLHHRQEKVIPEKYILKRWTQEAALIFLRPSNCERSTIGEEKREKSARYNNLLTNFRNIATMAVDNEDAYKYVAEHSMDLCEGLNKILREAAHKEPLPPRDHDENANFCEGGNAANEVSESQPVQYHDRLSNDEVIQDKGTELHIHVEKTTAVASCAKRVKFLRKEVEPLDSGRIKTGTEKGQKKKNRGLSITKPNPLRFRNLAPRQSGQQMPSHMHQQHQGPQNQPYLWMYRPPSFMNNQGNSLMHQCIPGWHSQPNPYLIHLQPVQHDRVNPSITHSQTSFSQKVQETSTIQTQEGSILDSQDIPNA